MKIKCDICGRTQTIANPDEKQYDVKAKRLSKQQYRRHRWFVLFNKNEPVQTICGGDPLGGKFDACLQKTKKEKDFELHLIHPGLFGEIIEGAHIVR